MTFYVTQTDAFLSVLPPKPARRGTYQTEVLERES